MQGLVFEKVEDQVGVGRGETLWVLEVGVDMVLVFEGVGRMGLELEVEDD